MSVAPDTNAMCTSRSYRAMASVAFAVAAIVLPASGSVAYDFAPSAYWRTPGLQRCLILTGNPSCRLTLPPRPRPRPFVYPHVPSAPPPPSLAELQSGYRQLVQVLPADADPAWLASVSTDPSSPEELQARLEQLAHDLLAFRDYDYNALLETRRHINDAAEIRSTLLSNIERLQSENAKLAPQAAHAQAALKALAANQARIEREEAALGELQIRAEHDLSAVRRSVLAWLFAFTPEPKVPHWEALSLYADGADDLHIESPPLVTPRPKPTLIPFDLVAASAAATPMPHYPRGPQTMSGPPAAEMQTLYQIANQDVALRGDLASARRTLAPMQTSINNLAAQDETLNARWSSLRSQIDQYDIPTVRARRENLANTWVHARDSAALKVVQSYLWETWKEKVVKPAVYEAIAQAANSSVRAELGEKLTDAKVEVLYKGGKLALESTGFNRLRRFATVERDTLAMLHDEEVLIKRAPEILAFGSPAETNAYVQEVTHFLDVSGEKLQSDAGYSTASRLPATVQKIARKLHLMEGE